MFSDNGGPDYRDVQLKQLREDTIPDLEARLNNAYSQRNALAIAFAKAALAAGWKAGRGYDNNPEKGWDPEWLHVVYVDLPNGQQVSWHMGPDDVKFLDQLPQYDGEWDGTAIGRDTSWCEFGGCP